MTEPLRSGIITVTGQPAPPVLPAKLCIVCEKACISMCPACRRYVCHSYGQLGPACSLVHEQTCNGAKDLRDGKKIG
jgi:hypothetical protein